MNETIGSSDHDDNGVVKQISKLEDAVEELGDSSSESGIDKEEAASWITVIIRAILAGIGK